MIREKGATTEAHMYSHYDCTTWIYGGLWDFTVRLMECERNDTGALCFYTFERSVHWKGAL